jgi:hypothetical protein
MFGAIVARTRFVNVAMLRFALVGKNVAGKQQRHGNSH